MANKYLLQQGSAIRFYVSGSFSPVDSGTDWSSGLTIGTNVVLTLSGVANAAARQSAKFDFGATWARAHTLYGCVDFTGETPTGGNTVDYYLAPSTSFTTGVGNVAGNSGNDAACPDGALGSITLSEFLKWCDLIGSLIVHDGASVQNGMVGTFVPRARYGQLIVVNNSGDAFEADDVEAHQIILPLEDLDEAI